MSKKLAKQDAADEMLKKLKGGMSVSLVMDAKVEAVSNSPSCAGADATVNTYQFMVYIYHIYT